MRKALNENTTVQIAIIAVLMLAAGLMLVTQMKGGGGGEAADDPNQAATGGAVVSGTDSSATAAISPAADPATATAPTAQPAKTVAPLESGPGLPASVLADYNDGKTIVLLIVRAGGIDDRMVKGAVETLRGDSKLAVYVTRASGIARYSRITQGVGVSQVPALVVVSPRSVGGGSPAASVEYGFRAPESVVQAVRDAAYKGHDVGYDPG